MKKYLNKKYLLIGIMAVLAISSVFMTIEAATSGMEVSSLRKQESKLADQKRYLEETMVRGLSLGELQQKSTEMGYIKPVAMVYAVPSEAVAKLP